MADDAPAVKSADRLLDLFELLARRSQGASHTEIAAALGIPKSSLTQLMKNLTGRKYVRFVEGARRYELGERFHALAHQTSHRLDIVALARPILTDLAQVVGESCALNILVDDMAEVAIAIDSDQRLFSRMRTGERAPLYATSGGKAILAALPAEEREAYLKSLKFEKITPNTLTSALAVRRELAKVLQEGLAHSFEEYTPGIVGLGKAVLGDDGAVLGAINVAMPAIRYDTPKESLVANALARAVSDLHDSIGSRGRPL